MKELIRTFLVGLAVVIPLLILIVLFNMYPQVMSIIGIGLLGLVIVLFVGLVVRDIFDDY